MKAHSRGFTLIEIIGVLTIIAILASAITPNIAREVKRAIAEAEDKSLASIAEALHRSVLEFHALPGTAVGQWNADASPYLSIPSSQIIQNRGSGSRSLILRPTNGLPSAPYNQKTSFEAGASAQGTLPASAPLQARMLIVSDLDGAPPGGALSDAQFDAVWDQAGTIPNGYAASDKLRLSRIGFASLFYPVTVTCGSIAGVPRWSLDASAIKSLNAGSFTVYLTVGTKINLFLGAVATVSLVVDRPMGITYNGSVWSY